MKRSRGERRAQPARWWRIIASATQTKVLPVGDGQQVYVRGEVQDATVVQLSERLSRAAGPALFEAIQKTLKGAGVENAVIVPAGVHFMQLEPVSEAKAEELDRRSVAAEQAEEKARMH